MADRDSMLRDLQDLATGEAGRARLRRAFDLFGVKATKWSEMTPEQIGDVWAETRNEEPSETQDESRFNANIPFS